MCKSFLTNSMEKVPHYLLVFFFLMGSYKNLNIDLIFSSILVKGVKCFHVHVWYLYFCIVSICSAHLTISVFYPNFALQNSHLRKSVSLSHPPCTLTKNIKDIFEIHFLEFWEQIYLGLFAFSLRITSFLDCLWLHHPHHPPTAPQDSTTSPCHHVSSISLNNSLN